MIQAKFLDCTLRGCIWICWLNLRVLVSTGAYWKLVCGKPCPRNRPAVASRARSQQLSPDLDERSPDQSSNGGRSVPTRD
jgi:hypothetical protein